MFHTDTIAAISTGMTSSGIGIIRISGPDAIAIADKVYDSRSGKKLENMPTHTIHYGFIRDGEEFIDEVLVMLMRGPRSFTAEDTVEINCHGGVYAMNRILELVIRKGARPAQPGEFTKRAFLNGRIDLSQAEAVIDVINAKNEYALKSSVSQLKGSVLKVIKDIREKIIYHIAYIESALDDPEHISLDGYPKQLEEQVEQWKEKIRTLIASSENGKRMKEGIRTVIVGKPNAGKSSLLNVLLGEERAIVTDIAGTTRDVLEEQMSLSGISLNIIDTAGIRSTEDVVEKIGVKKAKTYARDADLIIYVVDSSTGLDENDEEIMEMIRDRKAIVLLNKMDLDCITTEEDIRKHLDKPVIPVSAKEEQGIDRLEQTVKDMFYDGSISFNDEIYITNMRQKAALKEALDSLEQVSVSIQNQMPEDFFSIDMMNAYEELGSITGESVGEDLVNEIFSKFCMGK
ncbi:tRNA uridine-5-carboxymethylaminomethyl(34) synthesis GTPase MnmE [Jingyaoa shaoxingensis]|uniref:tRNA modification GTPase MnmE n=1 Tax=Jingyaoa shaoxingensis TaxID=2763671 RepID=A0ABR7NDX1_9FIRM|nr:tRNA uridine-5-carboxymethylaminomethyl(34) synthesis GTPase MnmE [Jingyaoa shaoxingensis]MBC8574375.1 tRNA uridine-5-carboxymethylaminomethyl(34) synthesis GTPase MnmE [Jingyaoa shaoxingensis]